MPSAEVRNYATYSCALVKPVTEKMGEARRKVLVYQGSDEDTAAQWSASNTPDRYTTPINRSVLYCTVLCCTVLYYTALYCTALYCN